MAAIIYDLELDEGRDNSVTFRWLDRNNNPIDMFNFGAIAELRTSEGKLISRLTDTTFINILRPEETDEDYGLTVGRFTLTFPAKDLIKPVAYKGIWELVVFPDREEPKEKPIALLRGKVKIRPKVVSLDE